MRELNFDSSLSKPTKFLQLLWLHFGLLSSFAAFDSIRQVPRCPRS